MAQTVLITGCSSGIGRATAKAFAKTGWNVIATMRDPAAWDEPDSDGILATALDVGDPASIEAAVSAGIERFGRIDCLVNNAGQALLSVVETTPIDTARHVFDVNLFGPLQVMQAVLPRFREQGAGRIVNVSSGSAITPDPFMAIYSASKFAVEGLTEGMRHELAGPNITLKLVEPGHVPSTNIGATVMANSKDIPVPPAYKSDMDKIMAHFSGTPPADATDESQVAETIMVAASDDTDTLRFVVGKDAQDAAHMPRETSEQDYLAWSAKRFDPR